MRTVVYDIGHHHIVDGRVSVEGQVIRLTCRTCGTTGEKPQDLQSVTCVVAQVTKGWGLCWQSGPGC